MTGPGVKDGKIGFRNRIKRLSRSGFLSKNNGPILPPGGTIDQPISKSDVVWEEDVSFENPWDSARRKLSGEEGHSLAIILSAIDNGLLPFEPDALLEAVTIKRKFCEQKRWTFKCGKNAVRLQNAADKTLDWLQKFKEIGDIAVNADPVHAGLPWAGIRLLLLASISERSQMESLLRGLNRIFYILYRCRLYEKLYSYQKKGSAANRNLHFALVDLYAVILRFLGCAMRIYDRNFIKRAFSAFWTLDEIRNFEEEIQRLEKVAEMEAQNCERVESAEARSVMLALSTSQLQLTEGSHENVLNKLDGINRKAWESEVKDILNWVSTVPFEDHHKAACKGRTTNTGEWIIKHEQYQAWDSSGQSEILWLHGIPGAGKTKLVSRIIDSFTGDQPRHSLAYFYCSRHESSRCDPKAVLRSLVRQLSWSAEDDDIQEVLVDEYQERSQKGKVLSELTMDESKALLSKLAEVHSRATIVIDALDELLGDRQELLEFFENLACESDNIKILIASRRDDDIKYKLEQKRNHGIEATDNQGDIGRFVEERIEKNVAQRRTALSNELKHTIVETLLAKSQGMFQWAALQIDQILRLRLEADIKGRLGQLPKDLKSAYDEIFAKIQSSDGSKGDIALLAFQWVLFAYEPLAPDTLVDFLSRDLSSGKVKHTDIDIHFVLDACANLLIVDVFTGMCRFSHFSVHEYFAERHYNPDRPNGLADAQSMLVTATIRRIIAMEIHAQDINRHPKPPPSRESLIYAAKFWCHHAKKAFDSAALPELENLVCALLGDFYSNKLSEEFSNCGRIYNCCQDFEEPDESMDLFFPADKIDQRGPLYHASLMGFESCVKRMIRAGSNISGFRPLPIMAAALNCHAEIVRLLLVEPPLPTDGLIITSSVSSIMKRISGNMQDTIFALLDLEPLYDTQISDGGTQSKLKLDIVLGAAQNEESGDKIFRAIFEYDSSIVSITERLIQSAAWNVESGAEIVRFLLESDMTEVAITDSMMYDAAANSGCGELLLETLFENQILRSGSVKISDNVVMAAVENKRRGHKVIETILNTPGTEITITEMLAKKAASNSLCGEEVMIKLLVKRQPEINMTPIAIETILNKFGPQVVRPLLEKQELKSGLTEGIIIAAAANENWKDDILQILLERWPADVFITETVVHAVAGVYKYPLKAREPEPSFPLTLPYRSIVDTYLNPQPESMDERDEWPSMPFIYHEKGPQHQTAITYPPPYQPGPIVQQTSVTYPPVYQADRAHVSRDKPQYPAPPQFTRQKQIELLDSVRKERTMIHLLTRQATKVEITEPVIAEIARYLSVEVMEVLLDQLGNSLIITESIIRACVENKEHGHQIITLLLEEYCQVPVTDDILLAAKEHPEGELITSQLNESQRMGDALE